MDEKQKADLQMARSSGAFILLAGVLAADDPHGVPPTERGKAERVRYALEMTDRLLAELAK